MKRTQRGCIWTVRFLAVAVLAGLPGSRADAQGAPAAALAPYVGEWRAEPGTSPDGRGFRFGYSLQWFDPGKTIVKMRITQHFDDGESRLLWEGFKGVDPVSGGLYYHGFSPSGRAARGEVMLEAEDLITAYEGWGPGGVVVQIRDRFLPVDGDAFTSITSMWRNEAWQEIMRDTWTRLEGS